MRHVRLRSLAVVFAVALALVVPGLVMGLHLGLDQAEFAAQGDMTLRAAGYAFSIWGPIYLGLVAYAVYQWQRETPALRTFGWPSAVSAACCAGWIVATALNRQWIAVIIIVVGALAASLPFVRVGRVVARGRERWLIVWPNAVLAGWLLLAAALAILTVLTAQGDIRPETRMGWALGGLVVVTSGVALLALRSGLAIVLAPVIWGLVAVLVAERQTQIPVAAAAGLAAGILAVLAVLLTVRGRAAARGQSKGPGQREANISV